MHANPEPPRNPTSLPGDVPKSGLNKRASARDAIDVSSFTITFSLKQIPHSIRSRICHHARQHSERKLPPRLPTLTVRWPGALCACFSFKSMNEAATTAKQRRTPRAYCANHDETASLSDQFRRPSWGLPPALSGTFKQIKLERAAPHPIIAIKVSKALRS